MRRQLRHNGWLRSFLYGPRLKLKIAWVWRRYAMRCLLMYDSCSGLPHGKEQGGGILLNDSMKSSLHFPIPKVQAAF